MPFQDLRVTKGHALWLDGVLIPVEFLINHLSIAWDDAAHEVSFFHVELATHAVLLANGAPAESYRDDGNRWLFRNWNEGREAPPKPPCAEVVTGGPLVDAIWRRLRDRANPGPAEPTTAEPDLTLLVDGEPVRGRSCGDGVHVFPLPRRPLDVRVVSRSDAQDELGLARDPRHLGVALGRIAVWYGTRVAMVEASDPSLVHGFHEFEPEQGFRWTDGDARLPSSLFAGLAGPSQLEVHVVRTARYRRSPNDLRRAAEAG